MKRLITILVLLLTPIISNAGLNTGLVGYWSMDKRDFNTTTSIIDRSGNGNHGTLINTSSSKLYRGKIGQMIDLTDTTDYISINRSFNYTYSTVTYAFWGWFSGVGAEIFLDDGGERGGASESSGLGIGAGIGNADTTGNNLLIPLWGVSWQDTGVNIGTGWHHIVVTLQSGKTNAYIDGNLIFTGVSTMNAAQNTPLYLGQDGSVPLIRSYFGQFDEVRIYSRVLSNNEIKDLYRLVSSRGNLINTGRMKSGSFMGALIKSIGIF